MTFRRQGPFADKCLRDPEAHEVRVDEALVPAAKVTLERMLEYAGR